MNADGKVGNQFVVRISVFIRMQSAWIYKDLFMRLASTIATTWLVWIPVSSLVRMNGRL